MSADELLTIDDIAALWKVTRKHAQRYLVKRVEFPERIPGSTTQKPRWRRSDVMAFIAPPDGNASRADG